MINERNKPKLLKNVVEELIKEFGWDDKVEESKLDDIWSEIVGEKLAGQAKIKKFENGNLYIDITSSVWRSEILLRKEALRKELNQKVGKDIVKQIII